MVCVYIVCMYRIDGTWCVAYIICAYMMHLCTWCAYIMYLLRTLCVHCAFPLIRDVDVKWTKYSARWNISKDMRFLHVHVTCMYVLCSFCA